MSVKVTSTYVAADSATDNLTGYKCPDCGKMFRRDATLRRHREVSHASTTDDASRRYRCPTCRRPFTSRTTLNAHVNVAHSVDCSSTRKTDNFPSGVGKELDDTDGELLLVENCCVDDEICIAADGGSAEFQTTVTTEECVTRTTEKSGDQVLRYQTSSNSSSVNATSLAASTVLTDVTVSHCNNNNNQTKNKNAVTTSTAPSVCTRNAVRSALSSTNVTQSSDVRIPTITNTTSMVKVNGVDELATSQNAHVTTAVCITGSSAVAASGGSTARVASACRAAVEAPKLSTITRAAAAQRGTINNAVQQKTPRSPLEAETFHGDARKPEDSSAVSGFAPTSTTQKIIVYVKSEPNPQQIAYCAAESTTSGTGKTSAVPCQFVCPVCGRDFASEKYLSMHVSSIHRATTDVASIIALETTPIPVSVGPRTTAAGTPNSAADVTVTLTATSSGTLTVQPTSSTSVGGSKSHWTCNICRKAFAQNSSYKNHIRTHSDDRPYVCSICSIGFKERYHLKKHELFKHTTALNETCRICGKRFKDSTAVRAHERIHSDVRPYGCPLCGKTFKTSECLWHHENRSKTCGKMASRNKHLGLAGVVTLPPQRQRRATVNVVSTALTSSRQLRNTSSVITPQFEPIEEDIKPEIVEIKQPATEVEEDPTPPAVASSSQEVVDDGKVVIKSEPDSELFDVNLLESSDTSFVDFWRTLDDLDSMTPGYDAIDNDLAPSPNPICSSPDTTDADSTRSADETSATIGSTTVSSNDVGGCSSMKRYDCARCDKRFASAATLAKHLQVHAEVRPYRCTVCDIGFKLKVHLKKHNLYRHSEEYPCECSICGKRFKDSSAVRLHERIHSTARPFQCLHCGKSFKTRENLWGHRNRGPCEQRCASSILPASPSTSHPVSTASLSTPQFVANNVRLFHSAEFGPILGVPVNAKLVFKDGDKSTKVDSRPANVTSNAAKFTNAATASLLTGCSANNLRRVSAVRVGDTTRLAVSKIATGSSSGGLSLVSVPTAVVAPIQRDQKLSSLVDTPTTTVMAGNFVISATSHAGHAGDRKRSVVELGTDAAAMSPHKYLAVAPATNNDEAAAHKCPSMHRLLMPQADETLLSPNMEQNLTDALNALVGQTDTMIVEGDCLPSIGETETVWQPSTNYDEELNVCGDDWSELVAGSCDQLLSSTDEDDALSEGGSLSDYRQLITSPSLGDAVSRSPAAAGDEESDIPDERTQVASDTMWCNWAPENDLGSLLIFGP